MNKVVWHGAGFQLREAKFAVQPAGRNRTRREGVKNVHAFVRGYFYDERMDWRCCELVTYNPLKYETFVLRDSEESIMKADIVFLGSNELGLPLIMATRR